jgi:hypothetical protein
MRAVRPVYVVGVALLVPPVCRGVDARRCHGPAKRAWSGPRPAAESEVVPCAPGSASCSYC